MVGTAEAGGATHSSRCEAQAKKAKQHRGSRRGCNEVWQGLVRVGNMVAMASLDARLTRAVQQGPWPHHGFRSGCCCPATARRTALLDTTATTRANARCARRPAVVRAAPPIALPRCPSHRPTVLPAPWQLVPLTGIPPAPIHSTLPQPGTPPPAASHPICPTVVPLPPLPAFQYWFTLYLLSAPPTPQASDAVARYLGLQRGQVVRIVREAQRDGGPVRHLPLLRLDGRVCRAPIHGALACHVVMVVTSASRTRCRVGTCTRRRGP